jgi:hypothetical protein
VCLLGIVLLTSAAGCGGGSDSSDPPPPPPPPPPSKYDIVVYGGTPSGIMAAVQSARLGKKVLLIEPTAWIGGMVTGGLSQTDIGTWTMIGGLALEFFTRTSALEIPRGGSPVESNGVVFNVEPHIALQTFDTMLADADVATHVGSPLQSVNIQNGKVMTIDLADGSRYTAQVFVDSSYEGDLMAMAGIPYTVGREAASSAEPDAGVQAASPVTPAVSPYKTVGAASSGLLAEITNGPGPAPGSADNTVMAYNYRFCVTDVATHGANAIPFSQLKPANYSEAAYAGPQRIIDAAIQTESGAAVAGIFFDPDVVPNSSPPVFAPYADGKFDINGGAPFSTDYVLLPNQYPDGTFSERQQVADQIQSYDEGLLYFLSNSPNVPASVSAFVNQFGACKDEFAANGNLPTRLYVREGRRMQGAYVMSELDVLNKEQPTPTDVIGMGGYNMDSHIHQLLNIGGVIYQEGNNSADLGYGCSNGTCAIKPGTPFLIPYRALTPAATAATNVLVSVTVSATDMAYRALRVEPQYMIMGQAAGAAASLAIDEAVAVQDVSYSKLQGLLVQPQTAGQPAQVILPCYLKGTVTTTTAAITAYKALTATTCSSQVFTCASGTWENAQNISPVDYYPSCQQALDGAAARAKLLR